MIRTTTTDVCAKAVGRGITSMSCRATTDVAHANKQNLVLGHDHYTDQKPFMDDGWLEQGDVVPLEQLSGLCDSLIHLFGTDFNPIGIYELGQLANLKPAIGQHGQKLVVILGIGVRPFARVVKLGRAFKRQLEAGFGQVALTWATFHLDLNPGPTIGRAAGQHTLYPSHALPWAPR